jgi:ribosomal protein S18 acetylase RimI-like enzyme
MADLIARVHWQTSQEAYTDALPVSYIASFSEKDRKKLWSEFLGSHGPDKFLLVAETDVPPKIVGFLAAGPSRDVERNQDGEIYAMYVRAPYQRRRIGTMLFSEAMRIFQRGDIRTVGAWVLENNSGAIAFYKHHRGIVAGKKVDVVGSDLRLNQLPYSFLIALV